MAGTTYDRRRRPIGADPQARPQVRRRTIKRDKDTTQLLERSEGPAAETPLESAERVIPPGDHTTSTDEAFGPERPDGPPHSPSAAADPPNTWAGGAGGGRTNTLGGETYPETGSAFEDVWEHSGARDRDGEAGSGDEPAPAGAPYSGQERRVAERRSGQATASTERGREHPRLERRRPSDETLADEIHQVLTLDAELEAIDVVVEVEDGTVTLTGVVQNLDAKHLAEELVESVIGVQEVHNYLEVAR